MSKSIWRLTLSTIFTFCLLPILVFGQDLDNLCSAFLDRAFNDIGVNCANLNGDELCYGFGNPGDVISTLYVDGNTNQPNDDFDAPSDRVALINISADTTVETVTTDDFFLDLEGSDNHWGVSVMEVQANLPRQLNQRAVFILFGNAHIENAVLPEDALVLPAAPVTVATTGSASLYGSPANLGYSVASDVVHVFNEATSLDADGISPDGQWLRVLAPYERTLGNSRATAWLRVADVNSTSALNNLPIIGPETYTPMQKLYLETSSSDPLCDEAPPPGLLIQGPEANGTTYEVDFVINDTPIRVASTAYIELTSNQQMRITTISGFAILFPETPNQLIIPPGLTRHVCLRPESGPGVNGINDNHTLEPACDGDGLTSNNIGNLSGLSGIPTNLLSYSIEPPIQTCASGIGGSTCTVILLSTEEQSQIESLCASGLLSEEECDQYGQ